MQKTIESASHSMVPQENSPDRTYLEYYYHVYKFGLFIRIA